MEMLLKKETGTANGHIAEKKTTFSQVGVSPVFLTTPSFPAMAVFLKGISIGLKAGG